MTKQTRLVLAGTAAALVAAVSLVGGALRGSGGSTRAVPVKASAAGETFAAGFSGGDTASFVRRLVDELRAHPGDAQGYTLLGLAYQQRARETGNPAYYTKSEQALDRARKLAPAGFGDGERPRIARPGPPPVPRGAGPRPRGGAARSVHGAQLRRRRRRAVELGRYDEAFRTFDHMARCGPTSPRTRASRTRVSCSAGRMRRSRR